MTNSVPDVFRLLGELSEDEIFAKRVQASVDDALRLDGARREAKLVDVYREAEAELLKRAKGRIGPDDLRRQVRSLLAGAAPEYPGFRLMFLPPEHQLVALGSVLIVAYAEKSRMCFGPRIFARLLTASLHGTPWENTHVSPEEGIAFDAVRMRSLAEAGEIISLVLEQVYGKTRAMLGGQVARGLFERAYDDVESSFGFLPMMRNLLGLTPHRVLWSEKVKRLHELESQTTLQARNIHAADVDLAQQAERLQQTGSELDATRRQLEIVSQARSEFVDVVSHQFRTPLSSIRWSGELLADALAEKKIDASYAEAVETIRQRSVYLIDTLDRVFDVLDIETDKMSIDIKPGFLWEVVQDASAQFEKEMQRRNLKWKFQRAKESLGEIPMDKAKIATVLKILVGNAVTYTKDGGAITASVADQMIEGVEHHVFTITDDGIGIPPSDLDRIFDKFFRSKLAVLKASDGTGLGMFIVKHVVEAHRGTVHIESAGEGKGTTVTIALPVK